MRSYFKLYRVKQGQHHIFYANADLAGPEGELIYWKLPKKDFFISFWNQILDDEIQPYFIGNFGRITTTKPDPN
jgi:hypothetical protein